MKSLLDSIQNDLSEEEEQVAASVSAEHAEAIASALALRTAVKAQSLKKGLYLSETSIDSLTAALLLSICD